MKLKLIAVRTGKTLGEITINGAAVEYSNSSTEAVLASIVRRAGAKALEGWSNGYLAVRPLT